MLDAVLAAAELGCAGWGLAAFRLRRLRHLTSPFLWDWSQVLLRIPSSVKALVFGRIAFCGWQNSSPEKGRILGFGMAKFES